MPRRGPSKTPTKLLKLRDSQLVRKRKGEPEPAPGCPDPPPHLDSVALGKWAELCAILDGMGVLTVADADALSLYCQKWARMLAIAADVRERGLVYEVIGKGGKVNSVRVYEPARELSALENDLTKLGQQFGLTPSARANLSVETKATDATAGYFKTA